jgi:hypothetical protein
VHAGHGGRPAGSLAGATRDQDTSGAMRQICASSQRIAELIADLDQALAE